MTMLPSRKKFGFLATLMATAVCLVASAVPAFADVTQAAIADPVQRGQVVVFKYDAENAVAEEDALPAGGSDKTPGTHESWNSIVQGEANLAGAEFSITNRSQNDIDFIDDFGHYTTIAVGESFTIPTKWVSADNLRELGVTVSEAVEEANGAVVAMTPHNGLPVGTYEIKETKAGEGYGLIDNRTSLTHPYVFGYMDENKAKWSTQGYWFEIKSENDIVVFDGDRTAEGDHGTQSAPFTKDSTDAPGAFNPAIRGGIEVSKLDHDLQESYAQGNATLEGTEFTIYNYNEAPVRVWSHFTYDENGQQHGEYLKTVQPGQIIGKIVTGEDGTARTFMDALPAGWYKVVETKAPEGYKLESGWVGYAQISGDDWDSLVVTRNDDPIMRGNLTVHKVDKDFVDIELGDVEGEVDEDTKHAAEIEAEKRGPQGDATFEGIEYTVYNISKHDIYRYDEGATPDKFGVVAGKRIPSADEPCEKNIVDTRTIKAGSNTVTFEGLPYGTYIVKETAVPEDSGYALNSEWSYTFTITEEGQTEDVWCEDKIDSLANTCHIFKLNFETGETDPFGNSSYEGVTVGLINKSQNEIVYGGKIVKPGETFGSFAYDPDISGIRIRGIPDGTYEAYEITAGTGNALNSEWRLTIVMPRDADKTFDATEGDEQTLMNRVIREDIRFSKVESGTNRPMANVAFKLTSKTTGEWHILVTDENGVVNTANWLPGDDHDSAGDPHWKEHSYNTNAADAAYVDGKIDDSKLTSDCGYWFYGNAENEGKVFDDFSALPYDTYILEELRCEANKGHDLVKREIFIGRANNNLNEFGTIDNPLYDPSDEPTVPIAGDSKLFAEKVAEPAASTQVEPGQDITYTIKYMNTSNTRAEGVHIRDFVPRTTTFKSASHDGVLVDAETSKDGIAYVEWVLPGVDPGESGEVTFTVTVDSNANSLIVNQARYGSVDEDNLPTPGDPDNQLPVGASNIVRHTTDGTTVPASMNVWKTADPAATEKVQIGDEITYTIHMRNDGGSDAFNLGVFDVVPQGTELVQVKNDEGYDVPSITNGGYLVGNMGIGWNIERIAPGETVDLSFTVRVTDKVYFTVMNQATWGTVKGLVTGCLCNSTNHVIHGVEKLPEVTITKAADKERTTVTGDILTYTLHVENNGYGNAYGIPVFDMIPENTQFVAGSMSSDFTPVEASNENPYVGWTIPRLLNGGGSADLSFQVRVKDKVAAGTLIENVALVGGTAPGGSTDEGTEGEGTENVLADLGRAIFGGEKAAEVVTDGITDMAQQAESNKVVHEVVDPLDNLEIQKTADPANGGHVAAGDEITYTIKWENKGTENINGFAVMDYIPEGTTFVPGSIVVTGADGKTSTELKEESKDEGNEDVKPDVPEDDDVVWTPVEVVGAQDPEGVYNAVIHDPENQIFKNFEAVRLALETSKPGDVIEFTVVNKGSYDELWRASVQADGRILLLKRIIVGNLDDSSNREQANGIIGNYDAKNKAVYALQTILRPGETGSISFKVKVNDDLEGNVTIHNRFTYGKDQYYAPTGDLEREGDHTVDITVGETGLVGTKSVTPEGPVQAGDILTYTITVTNNGTADAHGVGIYDEFGSAGLTYVNGSYRVSGGDSEEASKVYAALMNPQSTDIKAMADTLHPGESLVLQFDAKVTGASVGESVKNKATFGEDLETVTGPAGNETNETDSLIAVPGLSISKTAQPGSGTPVAAGDTIEYRFEVTNNGDVDARHVSVYDAIPLNTSLVAGSELNLTRDGEAMVAEDLTIAAHETHEFGFTVRVNGDVAENTVISNRATCGISTNALYPLDVDSNEVVHTVCAPNVRLVAEANPRHGSSVGVGDEVTYTLTAYNEGNTYARGVGLYNAIPNGMELVEGSVHGNGAAAAEDGSYVSALAGDIAPGSSASMTFKARVLNDTTGEIVSQGSWGHTMTEAPTSPMNRVANSVSVHVAEADVNLQVIQEPYDGASVNYGDVITYTVKATNNSGATATNVGLYDAIPNGATFVAESLTSDGVSTELIRDYSAAVEEGGSSWAEAVTPEEKEEIEANSPVKAVSGVIKSLGAGESASFTFKVTVDRGFKGIIVNEASWADGVTAAPTEPCANLSNDVEAFAEGSSISIVKAQNPGNGAFVTGGDELTYTITVKNTGKTVAKNVGIYDDAPEGTSLVENSLETDRGEVYYGEDGLLAVFAGDMLPGESATMTFKVTVNYGFTGTIHNRALWVSPAADPVRTPEPEVAQLNEVPAVATATAGAFPLDAIKAFFGIEQAYALNVEIPDGSDSGWSNDTGNPDEKPGDTTKPDQPSNPGDGDDADKPTGPDEGDDNKPGNPGDDGELTPPTDGDSNGSSSNETTATAVKPSIELIKSADVVDGSLVKDGDVITYTVKATNVGKVNGNNIAIRDVLPAGVEFVEGSLTGENCKPEYADGIIACITQIPVGESASFSFKVTVKNAEGNISNIAEWGQSPDGNTVPGDLDGSKSNDVTFITNQDIELIKTMNVADGSAVVAGDEITYMLTATNKGDVAHDIVIEDMIPAGTEYVEGSATADVTLDNGKLSFAPGVLEPGQSATFSFTVRVIDPDAVVEDESEGPIEALVSLFTGESKTTTPERVTEIRNVATWHEVGDEDHPGNSNEALVTIGMPNISVTKTSSVAAGSVVKPGDTVSYEIALANSGNGAGMVNLEDKLPEGLELVEGSLSENAQQVDGVIKADIKVAAGATEKVTYTVRVADSANGDITNSVVYVVNGKPGDHNPNATIKVDGTKQSPYEITKTANKAKWEKVGEEIAYTITVKNNTKSMASGMVVEDIMGAGLTYVSDDANGEVFGASNQTATGNAVLNLGSGTYVMNTDVTGVKKVNLPAGKYVIGTDGTYNVSMSINGGDPIHIDGFETATVDLKDLDNFELSVTRDGKEVTDKVVSLAKADVVSAKGSETAGVRFTVDVPAGETRTINVVAKVNDQASGKVINNADAYFGDTDPVAHASATVDKAGAKAGEELKKGSEKLPTTGQGLGLAVMLVCGLAAMGAGAWLFVRNRRRTE